MLIADDVESVQFRPPLREHHKIVSSEDSAFESMKHKSMPIDKGFCIVCNKCKYLHVNKICPQMKSSKIDCKFRHPVPCKYNEKVNMSRKGTVLFFIHCWF